MPKTSWIMVAALALGGCVAEYDDDPIGDESPIVGDDIPDPPAGTWPDNGPRDLGCGEGVYIHQTPNGQTVVVRAPYECQPVFWGEDWDLTDPIAEEAVDDEDWQENEWSVPLAPEPEWAEDAR